MSPEEYKSILAKYLPHAAVDPVYAFMSRHNVFFHITRKRTSKLGDYRWPQEHHPYHEISINGDLEPHLFLWVFLHEAAHLENRLHHPSSQPHGHEWQNEYRTLIANSIHLFPESVQPLLARLTARLPLNHTLMQQVETSLRRLDPAHREAMLLDQLPAGSRFLLADRPGMTFMTVERRRTRWLCRDTATGRSYTVSASAEVIPQ